LKTETAPNRKQMFAPVFHFKALDDEQGIIECIVSVFNCKDAAGDCVRPGFFKDSLAAKLPKGVWMHDWTRPIAKTLEAEEWLPGDKRLPDALKTLGGLYIKGQINLDVQDGRDAYSHLKFGTVDEFSFGYDVNEERWNSKEGCNDLLKGIIYEWSPVLVGCNRRTQTLGVKGQNVKKKSQYLGEYAEQEATFEAIRELNWSLIYGPLYSCLFYSDDSEAEKEALLTGAFNEFRDLSLAIFKAMMALTPAEMKSLQGEIKALYPKDASLTLADGKFLTQLETVLAAVGDCTERAKGIQSLRVKDNRTLSTESADKVLALTTSLGEMTAALKSLTEPAPAGDADGEADRTKAQADRDRLHKHLALTTGRHHA
jgi:HK97 family phage prohead protease